MKKKIPVFLILGVTVSAAALYLSLRNVPVSGLIRYLASINYLWILPSVLIVLVSFILRALRWQIILGSAYKVGFWRAYHPLMIGFMINCIIPGRVGEVARPAILKKNEGVPFSTGLATVAAERVFDVILLILLFAAVLAWVKIDPDLDITFGGHHLNRETLMAVSGGIMKLLLFLVTGIILVCIPWSRKKIKEAIQAVPALLFFSGPAFKEKLGQSVCAPLLRFIDNFAYGFALLKHPARIFACLGLSFIIWGLSAFSFYVMALGCPGIELTFSELAAVMVIICFFIALPSVPGYWGLWEAGGVFALALFGVSAEDAAGFTLANHAIQLIPIIIAGLVSALITGVNILHISSGDISVQVQDRLRHET
ncbi:MAG: lysylphosphatidylglycerol synthase transmembrane domain-containing protein [Pseudomonadota bacterium]